MAVMVTLTGKFVNPDESAALIGTRITFALVPADIPDQVLNETVVPGPVSAPISSGGAFTVTLRATDDPDLLANVDGPLVYRVTRQGLPGNYLIALPMPGPWDWTDIAPEPANDTVVIPGADGEPGIVTGPTPPASTESLWADTTVAGTDLPQTVSVFTYTDDTDPRPNATVVFWIPDPYTLPNPFAALPGDLVLRTTPDVLTSVTGITHLEHYTVSDYDDITTPDPDTAYLIVADP